MDQEVSQSDFGSSGGALPPLSGVSLGVSASGIRCRENPDLFVATLAPGSTIAGSLTRSQSPSAAVEWCRRNLPSGEARLLVVNSGNANAFTGRAGQTAVNAIASAAASLFDCPESAIYQASTGVIGTPMRHDLLINALPTARDRLTPYGWEAAAEAIMTTDSFPKLATRTAQIGNHTVTLNGIAKNSGSLAPDQATLLAFLFTDAAIPAPVLRQLLGRSVEQSFNCITLDTDSSTSDTALLCATGQAGNEPVFSAGDRRMNSFREALDDLTADLAKQVVTDGHGQKRFITIQVSGAANARAARKIGLSVANSSAIKTGATRSTLDWARIIIAVGRSGERADRDGLSVSVGGLTIVQQGEFVGAGEAAALDALMAEDVLDMQIDVGVGNGVGTIWTCDLNRRADGRALDQAF